MENWYGWIFLGLAYSGIGVFVWNLFKAGSDE